MKRILLYTATILMLASCGRQPIVENDFVDSLLQHHTPSAHAIAVENDLLFWKKRSDSIPDLEFRQKYAQALLARFQTSGDIHDLLRADSIYTVSSQAGKAEDAGLLLTLAHTRLLRHRFREAAAWVEKAAVVGSEKYAVQMTAFDAAYELGDANRTGAILRANQAPGDFAYNFRLSKQDHFSGSLDSAISHMQQAADVATSPALKGAALSNLADLYVHAGALQKAYSIYRQCVQQNSSDLHSLLGIGWLALVGDQDSQQANRIFSFVQERSKSPDALWKLIAANELTDSAKAGRYARQFSKQVSHPAYGNMYHKYLIDLYTGILGQPLSALALAQKELEHRDTPQTRAWLAWALGCSGQNNEAMQVYEQFVKGRPLEALELFWMGKLMQKAGKGYNAVQFFKAAEENKYDLSPRYQKELQVLLQ